MRSAWCVNCATGARFRAKLTAADLAADPRYTALGFRPGETLHDPKGCERCGGTGYRGRVGVFEVLEMTEDVRHLVRTDSDSSTIDKAAMAAGMTTMIDDGVAKCRAGITSPAEVLRVADNPVMQCRIISIAH